jgi:hypothetical protein
MSQLIKAPPPLYKSVNPPPPPLAKLICFNGPVPSTSLLITQRELAEERLAAKQARESVRAWRGLRVRIFQALERGARVEPGIRSAEVCARTRTGDSANTLILRIT